MARLSPRPAPLSAASDLLCAAVVAAEDRRFLRHAGADPWGVARAAVTLGRGGGGSTLTQQVPLPRCALPSPPIHTHTLAFSLSLRLRTASASLPPTLSASRPPFLPFFRALSPPSPHTDQSPPITRSSRTSSSATPEPRPGRSPSSPSPSPSSGASRRPRSSRRTWITSTWATGPSARLFSLPRTPHGHPTDNHGHLSGQVPRAQLASDLAAAA